MNEPSDEAYERPTLTPVTIETAAGSELDALAEALYGLRRRAESPTMGWCETDLELRARCKATGTLQANAAAAAPKQEGAELSKEDRAELSWWRSQFATRFPDGQLPVPGTALTGKRFELREVPPKMVVGVDLAVPGSESIVINVVADNGLIGQVIVQPQALGKNPTAALCAVVHDVVRMAEDFRVRGAIHINQAFDDVDPDRPVRPNMAGVQCCYAVAPNQVCRRVLQTDQPGWRHWEDGKEPALDDGVAFCPEHAAAEVKQPAAEPTACDACLEVPPNGHAAHACVALAAAILDYEDQLAWLRKREVETGQRVACCTVGGIHWMAAKPCPIHEKPRAPGTWVPTWDPFDYRTT